MYSFKYGGKNGKAIDVEIADDLVVVRTQKGVDLKESVELESSRKALNKLVPITEFPEADVTIFQCKDVKSKLTSFRDEARATLKQEKDVVFAGKTIQDKEHGTPMVYTENLFVKFLDGVDGSTCKSVLEKFGLTVKREITYAENAFFVEAPEGTGLAIFQLADDLLNHTDVELCHPEIIQKSERKNLNGQWHLHQAKVNGHDINQHANAKEAWATSMGENITIAIVDDGVDVDHEEFSGNGKVVAPRDVTLGSDDGKPKNLDDNHGTACAGVACANGISEATGVAPKSNLMPIRLRSNLGSQSEADAFEWAANKGADVISCSWGPTDGKWWSPSDSAHNRQTGLPDSTRLAIDYAIDKGRNGKGCVITWAAGNGNESVENDGYASYDQVIAVAACNDRGSRSVYSDFGESVWCAFPSNDFGHAPFQHPSPLTPGIWTVDRSNGAGYNAGSVTAGDAEGDFTNSFGGTSSACPGIAGIAALVLSANPELMWNDVKEIIKESCEKIDEIGGSYNEDGHSPYYGYGRPNAALAVELAKKSATSK